MLRLRGPGHQRARLSPHALRSRVRAGSGPLQRDLGLFPPRPRGVRRTELAGRPAPVPK